MSDDPGRGPLESYRKIPARRSALEISTWTRVAVVILGLGGLGVGGAAVFVTHLEAGPVALLAIGLIFTLIGISGRLPSRLKVGDNEAAWEGFQQFAVEISEGSAPERQPELLSALGDLAEVAPAVAAPAIGAVAYDNLIMRMLETLRSELDLFASKEQRLEEVRLSRDELVDAYIIGAGGRVTAVTIRASTKAMGASYIDALNAALGRINVGDVQPYGLLFITREPLPRAARDRLKHYYSKIVNVVVAGSPDKYKLAEAIRTVNAIPSSENESS